VPRIVEILVQFNPISLTFWRMTLSSSEVNLALSVEQLLLFDEEVFVIAVGFALTFDVLI